MKHIFDLTGKVALITGGGSGLGLAMASQFINLGATIVITGRNKEKLEKAKKELGEQCYTYVNDVTEKTTHGKLVSYINENIGDLEILVNNAGIHCKKTALLTTDEDFQSVMDTNINSVFSLTRTVLEGMLERKKGSVINISSMSALYGIPQVVAYSSAKTALLGLTRTLATEYSRHGIRFNVIAPGFIETKMVTEIMKKDPARKTKIIGRTPAGCFGTPDDIGMAAAFLASDASQFITGICLPVDGGNSIGF